jgi:hypothetical protein
MPNREACFEQTWRYTIAALIDTESLPGLVRVSLEGKDGFPSQQDKELN